MTTGATLRAFVLAAGLLPAVASAFVYPDASRTICGKDKMENMRDLDASMQAMGKPIGILRSSEGSCTGTLIDKDLFLTAHHCLAECSDLQVTFGYLSRSNETFKCKEIVETGNEDQNQDYLVIRLEGSPGVEHGWYDVSDKPLTPGQPLLIIHHPSGKPMKVSRNECTFQKYKDGMLFHRCDTEPGSSGSAILAPDYDHPENTRVVGVHAYGGCSSAPTSANSGPAMSHLVTLSHTLKAMSK